jgi:hypothetical protein
MGRSTMIAEIIMDYYGWSDVVCFGVRHPDNPPPGREMCWLPWDVFKRGSFMVGVFTGKDGDLLCVKKCGSWEDPEAWLSPGGRSILGATLKALYVRKVMDHLERFKKRS